LHECRQVFERSASECDKAPGQLGALHSDRTVLKLRLARGRIERRDGQLVHAQPFGSAEEALTPVHRHEGNAAAQICVGCHMHIHFSSARHHPGKLSFFQS